MTTILQLCSVLQSEIIKILGIDLSFYLTGSAVLGDYCRGSSDIDFVVLTKQDITQDQANALLYRRQTLVERYCEPTYRKFEGGMLQIDTFIDSSEATTIYWGTSGERIAERYHFNATDRLILMDYGYLIYGEDIRHRMTRPTYQDLMIDAKHVLQTARNHGRANGRYDSALWLLHITRAIYTMVTKRIASKGKAAQWVLDHYHPPYPELLRLAIDIRQHPATYAERACPEDWQKTLNLAIIQLEDVLEDILSKK